MLILVGDGTVIIHGMTVGTIRGATLGILHRIITTAGTARGIALITIVHPTGDGAAGMEAATGVHIITDRIIIPDHYITAVQAVHQEVAVMDDQMRAMADIVQVERTVRADILLQT